MKVLIATATIGSGAFWVPMNPLRRVLMNLEGEDPVKTGGRGRSRSGLGILNRVLAGLIAMAILGGTAAVEAADTVETWDVGATDVDFYLGAEGLGLPREDGALYGDILLGYGLIERLSAYLGTTFQSDRFLDQSEPQHYLGLFGTIHESDHVDFDVFLDFSSSTSGAAVTTAFELNLDRDPDMSSYGFYLRSGLVFAHDPADPGVAGTEPGIGHVAEINPGLYWSLSAHSQILVEYSTGYFPSPGAGEDNWQDGHIHLGFNRVLVDAVELITEVSVATETVDDVRPWATFAGIIVTLPATGQ